MLLPYPILEGQCASKFLILGCHFTRNEIPFTFDVTHRKYDSQPQLDPTQNFEMKDPEENPNWKGMCLCLDLYRSNDYVQFETDHIYLRTFLKVKESADDVRVIKFPLTKASSKEKNSIGQGQHHKYKNAVQKALKL